MNAPAIILVEPQLPENIGMAARAMANFGLTGLRLVAPREGWPQPGAWTAAAGADALLDRAALFTSVADAVADLHLVLATTARARGQMKRAIGPDEAVRESRARIAAGERVGILFGRERTGLENDAISLADAIVSIPADPAFASLNLAGAVLLISYEWARPAETPAARPGHGGRPAERGEVVALFEHLEAELDSARYYPPNKRAIMGRNLRDRLLRMTLSDHDVRTLRGVIRALTRARRP